MNANIALPAGWIWTTLGAIRLDRGRTVNPARSKDTIYELYSVPSYVSQRPEIIAGQEIGSNKQTVENDTVLLCKINPHLNRVWTVKSSSQLPKLASTEWIPFFPQEKVAADYLRYYLMHSAFREYLMQNVSGVGGSLMRVRPTAIDTYQFPLPPLRDQQNIVDIIETQFSRLDAAEAALKRLQANLRRYRAAVLKAACEGRLVPTEAELARAEGRTYEPAAALLARILAERRAQWQAEHPGKKYKEPVGLDVSGLPELPEGWCWATVEQLSSHRKYSLAIGPFGSSLKVSDYRESGVPLVFVRNIRAAKFSGLDDHFVSQAKANELKAHTITGGDILITKMGDPPGDACMYPLAATSGAVITADCIKLALCHECVGQTQLFVHFLNAAPVRDQVNHITQGVAQKKVSLERYRTVALPLPPLLEQARIANAIETLLSANGVLVDDVAANLKRAERLRQAILVSAFSGRLVSAPQDDALHQLPF